MSNSIFEETLRRSSPLTAMNSKPFLCESTEDDLEDLTEDADVHALLTTFAEGLLDDPDTDLCEYFDFFIDHFNIPPLEADAFSQYLVFEAERVIGGESNEDIKSFLKQLQKPPAKPEMTTANVLGPTPKGTAAFLQQLRTAKYPDPYGNPDPAKDVKVFDRAKTRYGHPYAPYNDQGGTPPLQNPILNVAVAGGKRYEAVDYVGMNIKNLNHWKVVDLTNNQFASGALLKSEAVTRADELNRQQDLLGERIACNDLQESLQTPKDPNRMAAYEAALKRSNWTMGGSVAQSGYGSSQLADLKAAQQLINERKARFHEGDLVSDELTAIQSEGKQRR